LGTVTCTLGTLASGAEEQRTITVTADSAGTVTNTASVSSDTADPNNLNTTASAVVQAKSVPTMPNIVVVMADDQPPLDGRLVNSMPNVKSIFVQHGITFDDFHSESPLCCPARAGFLTGQHTHNHHVVTNAARLFNPTETIVTELAGLGYETMLTGKYMNLYGKNCGKPINCAPTIPAGWDDWAAFGEPDYYNYDLWIGTRPGPATKVHYLAAPADYSTDVIAQRAVDLISGAPVDRPIFAWITPYAPHAPAIPAPRHANQQCSIQPWSPPNWNEADVSDKPLYVRQTALLKKPQSLQRMCRALKSVDELVGRVRDALTSSGRLNNTIFIYSGDNGMNMGEHRLDAKSAPYETRIPFYVSWPKELGSQPSTISERLQNIDLAPTLCDIVGCELGPYPNGQSTPDGRSFAPMLLGQASSMGRDAGLDEMPKGWHQPGWYAASTTAASPLASAGCAAADTGGCLWHYIEYPTTGERELYDISNGPCWLWQVGQPGDPCELANQVANPAYASLVTKLHARLVQLKTQHGR
jgi:arylsulfatase A-like enzyme